MISKHSEQQHNWERRWHPLLEQWVIIAATTGNRPWNGALVETDNDNMIADHDKNCYLCAGNTRANGEVNPKYKGPWAFDNDYPSFSKDAPSFVNEINSDQNSPLMQRDSNQGRCRVLCWTEKHNQTLATISTDEMKQVGRLWQDEYNTLSQDRNIRFLILIHTDKFMRLILLVIAFRGYVVAKRNGLLKTRLIYY